MVLGTVRRGRLLEEGFAINRKPNSHPQHSKNEEVQRAVYAWVKLILGSKCVNPA